MLTRLSTPSPFPQIPARQTAPAAQRQGFTDILHKDYLRIATKYIASLEAGRLKMVKPNDAMAISNQIDALKTIRASARRIAKILGDKDWERMLLKAKREHIEKSPTHSYDYSTKFYLDAFKVWIKKRKGQGKTETPVQREHYLTWKRWVDLAALIDRFFDGVNTFDISAHLANQKGLDHDTHNSSIRP